MSVDAVSSRPAISFSQEELKEGDLDDLKNLDRLPMVRSQADGPGPRPTAMLMRSDERKKEESKSQESKSQESKSQESKSQES